MAHDTNLICCKCMKDDKEENPRKCYVTGMSTLKKQCAELDLFDLLQRVNDMWARNQLAIHRTCSENLSLFVERLLATTKFYILGID